MGLQKGEEENMEDTQSQGTECSVADPKLVGTKANQSKLHIENEMLQVFKRTILNFSTCPIVPELGSYWLPFR